MADLSQSSALAAFSTGGAVAVYARNGVALTELRDRSLVMLRVHTSDAASVCAALSGYVSAQMLHATRTDPAALTLSPRQWLLISDDVSPASIVRQITAACDACLHTAIDVSDGMTVLQIRGENRRALLSIGCGLNFDSDGFGNGQCARTRLANIPLIVHRPHDTAVFDLYVDRSYSTYLWKWLTRGVDNIA